MNTHAPAVARNLCERAPDYVRSIAPYQPGKPVSELAREMGLDESRIIKLASNENPMGASPRALLAMRSALDEVARYPDGNGFELKAALAKKFGVAQNQLILGNGSNDVLELAARAFLGPGSSAVYSRHAFAVYPLAVQATIRISYAVLVSSGLSFLGIGVAPPTPDWGLMIAEGRSFVSFAPWIAGVPGTALAILLIALSVMGDGVREQFDPKLRKQG